MPRRVQKTHPNASQFDDVAPRVLDKFAARNPGHLRHALGLEFLDMDWPGAAFHESLEPLDLHSENTSADMVLVVVGDERTDHLDAILLGLIDESVDAPRGIHHKRFAS